MASILDKCVGVPRKDFAPGTILLSEGETSGRLYILAEGSVEVLRGDTQVAVLGEPGSVFGEMSVLLNRPHTATVRATSSVGVFEFDQFGGGTRTLAEAIAKSPAFSIAGGGAFLEFVEGKTLPAVAALERRAGG